MSCRNRLVLRCQGFGIKHLVEIADMIGPDLISFVLVRIVYFHQIRHDRICRESRSLVVPVGVPLVVKHLVLSLKKTFEIRIIDPFLSRIGVSRARLLTSATFRES